ARAARLTFSCGYAAVAGINADAPPGQWFLAVLRLCEGEDVKCGQRRGDPTNNGEAIKAWDQHEIYSFAAGLSIELVSEQGVELPGADERVLGADGARLPGVERREIFVIGEHLPRSREQGV